LVEVVGLRLFGRGFGLVDGRECVGGIAQASASSGFVQAQPDSGRASASPGKTCPSSAWRMAS
jgi:hypothetical protein